MKMHDDGASRSRQDDARRSTPRPARLVAMISGGGRTLVNLQKCIERSELNANISLVIASRADIAGVARARQYDLPTVVVRRREYPNEQAYHDALAQHLLEAEPDLVVLCGWVRWLRVDPPLQGRVLNIHPALLPKFGGHGMYGERVHQAVLEAGETMSGCTVHYVDDRYDHGPIVLQRTVPVHPDDTAETLAARVFEQECIAYPQAIRQVLENQQQQQQQQQ